MAMGKHITISSQIHKNEKITWRLTCRCDEKADQSEIKLVIDLRISVNRLASMCDKKKIHDDS